MAPNSCAPSKTKSGGPFKRLITFLFLATLSATPNRSENLSTILTANSSPEIIRQPTNVVGYAGPAVSLSVVATGTPPLAFQWWRNGESLPGETNSSLVFSPADNSHSGDYEVVVINRYDTVRSAVARVRIFGFQAGALDLSFQPNFGDNSVEIHRFALQADDKVVAIASFTSSTGRVSKIIRLNDDGSLDEAFQQGLLSGFGIGKVGAIIVDSNQGIIVAGDFDSVNGEPRNGIARLLPKGSLDDNFKPDGPHGRTVNAFCLQGNQVLIGGDFGVPPGIGRLNGDGTFDSEFKVGSGVNNAVNSIALQLTNIIIAGRFTRVNDIDRPNVARLSPNGPVDFFDFTTEIVLKRQNQTVSTLAVQLDQRIVVAGSSSYVAPAVCCNPQLPPRTIYERFLLRLEPNGALDASFTGPGIRFDTEIVVLPDIAVLPDGKLLISEQSVISKLNSDGTKDSSFITYEIKDKVYDLAVQKNNRILAAGTISAYYGVPCNGIIRILNSTNFGLPIELQSPQPNQELGRYPPPEIIADTSVEGNVSVNFYAGTDRIATAFSQPFAIQWTNPPLGTHQISAELLTNGVSQAVSTPITVSITNVWPSATSHITAGPYYPYSGIAIEIETTDPDGKIADATLFVNDVIVETLTNPPFTFSWNATNTGSFQLSVVAKDNDGASVTNQLDPVTVERAFRLTTNRTNVIENEGGLEITVERLGTPNSVALAHRPATAVSVRNLKGDYLDFSTNITFTAEGNTVRIPIRVFDDCIREQTEYFGVVLTHPQSGVPMDELTIRIDDNDTTSGSDCDQTQTPDRVEKFSELTLVLENERSLGAWRLDWEDSWRPSNSKISGLAGGTYDLAFKAVSLTRLPDALSIEVPLAMSVRESRTYISDPAIGSGALRVSINVSNGVWHLDGGNQRFTNHHSLSEIAAGEHLVTFTLPSEWRPIPPVTVDVLSSETVEVNAYAYAETRPAPNNPTFLRPIVLGAFTPAIQDSEIGDPFVYNGQIQTPVGFGSGVVVQRHVVLTAAHLLYDDLNGRLLNPGEVRWFFQRHAGEHEPAPLIPDNFYVLKEYVSRRNDELSRGVRPGQLTTNTAAFDVAVLYFSQPAGRNGSGGWIASEAIPNPWLSGNDRKQLVGYPVEDVSEPNKMHRTDTHAEPLSQIVGPLYRSRVITGLPGCSGAPFYVQRNTPPFGTRYFPAGVYLGSDEEGGLVRALDADVSDLIYRIANQLPPGTNQNGGQILPAPSGPATRVRVTFTFEPPEIRSRLLGLKLHRGLTSSSITADRIERRLPSGTVYTLDLPDVPGYVKPTNLVFSLPSTEAPIVQTFAYTRASSGNNPPVLYFANDGSLVGPAGSTVSIQSLTEFPLKGAFNWLELTTVTLPTTWRPSIGTNKSTFLRGKITLTGASSGK